MKIKGITVTTHFQKRDTTFQYDYYSIDVRVRAIEKGTDREFAFSYGDQYHDKGQDKAQGVIDAIQTLHGPQIPVLRVNAADIEDYE